MSPDPLIPTSAGNIFLTVVVPVHPLISKGVNSFTDMRDFFTMLDYKVEVPYICFVRYLRADFDGKVAGKN